MKQKCIGIISAMPEEIAGVIALLENRTRTILGKREYTTGTLNGIKTVVVFSRWGKVAAAATVTTLILRFDITELIFTGVAGAIAPNLKIGDVVIAERLIQHDMDARPLINRFEIPLLDTTFFTSDNDLRQKVTKSMEQIVDEKMLHQLISDEDLKQFEITVPTIFLGDIASGDQFFASQNQKEQLLNVLPTILCVEMEGAAVAQVCYEFDIPFCVIRTISDSSDDKSHIDFPQFIQNIASKYAVAFIKSFYNLS